MATRQDTRKVETEIRIDAPVEDVWRALTDPEELRRWFPLEARVVPGAGGTIFMSWGEGLEGDCRILAWEPGRRLRTGWFVPEGTAPEIDRGVLVVDYTLHGEGGSTTLRLVHSGFGPEASWDEEYDGVRRGWDYELRSLRHYLERHQGKQRRVAWARRSVDLPAAEAWERLWSPSGLLKQGRLPAGKEGDPYGFTTATGERIEGQVLVNRRPTDFAGSVDSLRGSLFRMGFENCGRGPEALLWLSTWDSSESEVRSTEARWSSMLAELFPAGS